jgi:hypothetical protein
MSAEFKDRFRRDSRALVICGILLVVLAFVPWIDRSHEIGAGTSFVYSGHLSGRVQEFMRSDEFVSGGKGTTYTPGYEVARTFPIGDGVVLAGSGVLVVLLGFLSARQLPDRRSALVRLGLVASLVFTLGFLAVVPNTQPDGVWHNEPSAPAADTWFKVFWDPTIGVWLAILVLVIAAWKVASIFLLSIKSAGP